MKYWRGYITAAIIAILTGVLMAFAKSHTVLLDMVYPYMTRFIQTSLAGWSASVNFCLWQLIVIVLAVILVMLVASRNVEYELEQEAKQAQTQVEQGNRLP